MFNLALKAARFSLIAVMMAAPVAVQAHGSSRQKASESVEINATAEQVWKAVGDFHDMGWLPGVVATKAGAKPEFAHRKLIFKSGAPISESLTKFDADNMTYSYRIDDGDVSVLPVTNYSSTITVTPQDNSKTLVEWRGAFYRGDPNDNPPVELNDENSIAAVHALYRKGLDNLKSEIETNQKAGATH